MMCTRKKYIEDNDVKTNYSTIFILPMLGYRESALGKQFISTYILNDKKPKIVLSFENSSNEEFKGLVWELQNHKEFVSIDYDDDGKEVVMVFTIPKKQVINYNLFTIGKYSKFSNDYKEVLLNAHGRVTGAGKCIKMIDALFPDHLAKTFRAEKMGVSVNDLVDGEVMSVMDEDREYYKRVEELTKIESK